VEKPNLTLVRKGASTRSSCAVVLVNGYLSETKLLSEDNDKWWDGLDECGWDGAIYHLWWDASHKGGIVSHMLDALGVAAPAGAVLANRSGAAIAAALGTFLGAGAMTHWRKVKRRAKRTGAQYVPKLLRDEVEEDEVVLIGHSAGARVVHYALRNYQYDSPEIRDVILNGGAIRRGTHHAWDKAVKPIRGKLYNVYHSDDHILRFLYKLGAPGLKSPCGMKPIKRQEFDSVTAEKIVNVDATEFGTSGYTNHWVYPRVLKDTVAKVLCGSEALSR